MVKKFFSVVLLLTVCAVAQASQTSAPATPTHRPASSEATGHCGKGDCTESKGMVASVCDGVCGCANSVKGMVAAHPYMSAVAACAACCAVAYNYSETFRSLFCSSCEDSEKCPCTKRDGVACR